MRTPAEAGADRGLLLAGLIFCALFRSASNSARAAMAAALKPNGCLDQMLTAASLQLHVLTPAEIREALALSDADFAAKQAAGRGSESDVGATISGAGGAGGGGSGEGGVDKTMRDDAALAWRLFDAALRTIPAVARNWY